MEEIARLKDEGFIELKLIPSEDTINVLEPSSLAYDWKVVDVTRNHMEIEVDFVYPLNVSMLGDFDRLQIIFSQCSEILKPAQKDIYKAFPAKYTIFVIIPPQKVDM